MAVLSGEMLRRQARAVDPDVLSWLTEHGLEHRRVKVDQPFDTNSDGTVNVVVYRLRANKMYLIDGEVASDRVRIRPKRPFPA